MSTSMRTAAVLCSHNGASFIAEQLDSIATQKLPVDEIHVFDWNSTDGTADIVRDRMQGSGSLHLACRSNAPGAGRSFLSALTEVASNTSADLIFIADQDDAWTANKAEVMVESFLGAQFDLAFSDVSIVDEGGKLLAPSFYASRSPYSKPRSETEDALLLTNPAIGMTMCVRKDWLVTLAPALEQDWRMHDWALCILCHLTRGRLRYIDRPLVRYRQHGGNLLGAAQTRSHLGRLLRLRGHVDNIRRQFDCVRRSSEDLGLDKRGEELLVLVSGRVRQAKLAWTPLLRPGYRAALAAAMLLL